MSYLFTSESVSEGHPDKVADQISDALIDNFLAFDKNSKVACETLVTTGQVILAGEVKSKTYLDVQQIARDVINKIGYTKSAYMFDGNSCGVLSAIHEQSPDINQGVDKMNPEEQGAGDQGLMFGFACNETKELMPIPIHLSHRLVERMTDLRKDGTIPWLRPDSKSQVSVAYQDGKPTLVTKVVIATQHDDMLDQFDTEKAEHDFVESEMINKVIIPVLNECGLSYENDFIVNGTGRFVFGGPEADTGLTGRKIIVDTYGGYAPHGGGAFSGKDPSKVDRSAAYMARYIAKNIVAANLADKCEVQLSYSIGVAEPTSFYVKSFGTSDLTDEELTEVAKKVFPVRPSGIIDHLKLKFPRYRETAANGHFGREDELFTWEKTDMVDELKSIANKGA